jgi:Flp pilus assembly secretin CpaC
MAAISGRPAKLLMGWRTPIPSETEIDTGGSGKPVTTYVYQNVGMTAHIRAVVLEGGRVHLKGEVDISGGEAARNQDTPTGRPPVIGTFQQSLEIVLTEGKPLRVAEVPDPDGGTHFLEITVEVIP